jgi:hypothetical protein
MVSYPPPPATSTGQAHAIQSEDGWGRAVPLPLAERPRSSRGGSWSPLGCGVAANAGRSVRPRGAPSPETSSSPFEIQCTFFVAIVGPIAASARWTILFFTATFDAPSGVAFQHQKTLGRIPELQNFGAQYRVRLDSQSSPFILATFLCTLQRGGCQTRCNTRYRAWG